ncbi:MAG: hypothetical protein KJ718_03160 [Nanoarchaeota archaeon]|nr:hypothetical protein [Nanoarchaeota archaeon]
MNAYQRRIVANILSIIVLEEQAHLMKKQLFVAMLEKFVTLTKMASLNVPE